MSGLALPHPPWPAAPIPPYTIPEFARSRAMDLDGVGCRHPRRSRLGFWKWDFPGRRWAVQVDGTIDDSRDRGWTVELALPLQGMAHLAAADGRALPPRPGDVWRMDLSHFNQYQEAPPADDPGGWAWSPHGVWDSHVPECFTHIHFASEDVTRCGSGDATG